MALFIQISFHIKHIHTPAVCLTGQINAFMLPSSAQSEICRETSRIVERNDAGVLTHADWCNCSTPSPPHVDAAWADISGSVEERKQHLEESNKNLEIFQGTELQLGQWLSEKELMMSVLGPLSIDPNMLKMQKQQVQVRMLCDVHTFVTLVTADFIIPVVSVAPFRSSTMNLKVVSLNMISSRKPPLPFLIRAIRIPQMASW